MFCVVILLDEQEKYTEKDYEKVNLCIASHNLELYRNKVWIVIAWVKVELRWLVAGGIRLCYI